MKSAFEQLTEFLKEMFQFDANDLDFGIFKILRLKRRYIEQFIDGDGDNDLRATVVRELSRVERVDAEAARNWLAAFAATYGNKGSSTWKEVETAPHDEAILARFRKYIS